jgi:hypothetical protein
MPNVTRGSDFPGLLRYLVGPGRENEHAEPHLVAGDQAMLSWWDDAELNADAAKHIAAHLDAPRRRMGVEIPGGHVWHCSLSLKAEEGQLPDARWAEVAGEFVDRMGFTESSGKAACRWVAVRHGVSKAGNDHVHLVVSLVRDDGTKASVWNDRPRAQQVARDLEQKYGLQVTAGRAAGVGSRGLKPAEQARAVREDRVEPVRPDLERRVRAAAAAASTEAEFVRRLRADRVLVHPRFAAGRGDVVVGYSVADRPTRGERPIWYGGGKLARDLTLTRLRDAWPDSPQTASAAVEEWTAAGRNRRVTAPSAERLERARRDPAELHAAAGQIADAQERLRSVPVDDRAAWAAVAHDSAGVFAAWSRRLETRPGPLAATATQLSKSAQLRAYQSPTTTVPPAQRGAARQAAALLLQASGATPQRTGELLLLRQLANTMKALHDTHQATGDVRLAAGIAALARGELVDIHDRYTRAVSDLTVLPADAGVGIGVRGSGGRGPAKPAEAGRAAAARRGAHPQAMGSPLPSPLPGAREPGWSAAGHQPTRKTPGPDHSRGAELD